MPNLAQVMKQEISRLARKEARAFTLNLQKDVVALKKRAAQQKKQISALQKGNKEVAGLLPSDQTAPQPPPDKVSGFRILGKGIRSMRKRLGLSQDQFAELVGVTGVCVWLWERKQGVLRRITRNSRAKLMWVKGLGAREAKRLLAEKSRKKATKARKGRR